MTDFSRTLKRLLALGLSSALIALSAGTDAYAAIGRSVEVTGAHAGPSAMPGAAVNIQVPSLGASAAALPGSSLSVQTLPSGASTPGAAAVPSLGAASAAASASGLQAAQPGAAPAASAPSAAAAEPASAAQPASAQDESAASGGASAIDGAVAGLQKAGETKIADTGRIASTVRSLKSLFGARAAQNVPGGASAPVAASPAGAEAPAAAIDPAARLQASPANAPSSAAGSSAAQADSGKGQPPAPPSGPNKGGDDDGGKGRFGFSRVITNFIAAALVAQIGIEALAASMPTLVQKVFGDFTVVAQLAIFSSIGGIIGRQLAPAFIANMGLKKVYLGAEVIRLVSISALIGLLITGHMTLPLMMGFYSINAMLAGTAVTAESSIPRVIIGKDQAKLERFSTWKQFLLEIIGVTAPILTGQVVAHFGFVPALVAYPLAIGASLVMLFLTLKIPASIEADRKAELAKNGGKSKGPAQIFKEFFARIARGAKLVWHTPALKYSFLAYTAYLMLNPWLYSMLASAYGLAIAGHAHSEMATSIGGWLTGLYSLGGLLGAVVMIFEQRRIKKAVGEEPVEPKETASQADKDAYAKAKAEYDAKTDAILRPSMLKWMGWATAGLAAIVTLAFPSPLFFGSLTIPALALIPFGVAQVIAMIKLQNFYSAKTPDNQVADANGFLGAASIAINTTGLLLLKQVFHHGAQLEASMTAGLNKVGLSFLAHLVLPGFGAFMAVGLAMLPLAAVYVWLTRKMAVVSKPDAPAAGGK